MKKFLGLLCLLLVAQACSTGAPVATAAASTLTGCTEVQNPDGPVVCVDDSMSPPKVSSYGKKLYVHSKLASGGHVYVTWKTINGADLDMKVAPDTNSGKKCYKTQLFTKTCKDDTCRIKVNPSAANGECPYDLWVNGELVDPVIVVEEWPFVPPVK